MFNKTRKIITGVALTLAVCSGSAFAVEQPLDGSSESSVTVLKTVRDLLLSESRMALDAQRKRERELSGRKDLTQPNIVGTLLPQPLTDSPSMLMDHEPAPATPKEPTTVLGIFGLGNNLFADVSIDSQRLRFQTGRGAPLGANQKSPYQLINIAPPCVKLKAHGVVRNLCVDDPRSE